MSTVRICTTCGRPHRIARHRYRFGRASNAFCSDHRHEGSVEMTDEQLNAIALAMRAYHRAKTLGERAEAISDWLAVLQGSAQLPEFDQPQLTQETR